MRRGGRSTVLGQQVSDITGPTAIHTLRLARYVILQTMCVFVQEHNHYFPVLITVCMLYIVLVWAVLTVWACHCPLPALPMV